MSKLMRFEIIERALGIYYVIFENQSLGVVHSKSAATKRVKKFARKNHILDYMTIYKENHIT